MNRRADLDGVRGVACLCVLVLHIFVGPIQSQPGSTYDMIRTAVQPFLVGGVDLFFVLSGFLIGGILMDEKARGTPAKGYFLGFWRRRFGRIFPVYYLMIGVLLALYAIDAIYSTHVSAGLLRDQMPVWTYASFTQNFYMVVTGAYGNFLGITWTLAVEEQFYLLLPLAVFYCRPGTVAKIAVALILIAPFFRTVVWEMYGWKASYHLSPARMDTVMWGALMAYAVRRADFMTILTKRTVWIDGSIVGGILLIATGAFDHLAAPLDRPGTLTFALFVSTLRYSIMAALYGLLILRLALPGAQAIKNVLSTRWLGAIGLVSYGAYMYHQFFNMGTYLVLRGHEPVIYGWDQAYMPLVVFVLTFAAAAVSYRFMELPILRWARRTSRRDTIPHSANQLKTVGATE